MKLGKESPLNQMGGGVCSKGEGWSRHKEDCPFEQGLAGKWIWGLAFEKDNLWKKVILVKYGREGFGWRSNEAYGTIGVGVWKEILKIEF